MKIANAAEYETALAEASALFDHPPTTGSVEEERLRLLIIAIENYEEREFAHEFGTAPTDLDAN
jgi:antitoxin component HigA of HigAB toxin-antitoxin module